MMCCAQEAIYPHELKSLRNQCVFGSSPPPFGGFLIVDVTIFHRTDVNPDDIRVTDLYSDMRVDRLMLAMRYLRHVNAPTATKAGTMVFFGIMMVARVAHESLCPALDRKTRMFMLNWALQALTSWTLPLTTYRGVVTSLVPLIMALQRKEIVKLSRIGERYIEYTFGKYRTLTNTDQLTVNNLLEVMEKQEVFDDP